MNDALDDILADSDDEEEEAAIVNKVLDEIGIEISGKVMSPCPVVDLDRSVEFCGFFRSTALYYQGTPTEGEEGSVQLTSLGSKLCTQVNNAFYIKSS